MACEQSFPGWQLPCLTSMRKSLPGVPCEILPLFTQVQPEWTLSKMQPKGMLARCPEWREARHGPAADERDQGLQLEQMTSC